MISIFKLSSLYITDITNHLVSTLLNGKTRGNMVVATGGITGSGKSTLAKRLVKKYGCTYLQNVFILSVMLSKTINKSCPILFRIENQQFLVELKICIMIC